MKPSVKLVPVVVGVLVVVALVAFVVVRDDGPTLPFDSGEQAASADDLVDSVGVNIHLSYADTAYGDYRRVKAALVDLGVRHVRDYPIPQNVERINDLAAEGIGLTAVMGTPRPRSWMPHDLDELYGWDPLESTCRHASLSIL